MRKYGRFSQFISLFVYMSKKVLNFFYMNINCVYSHDYSNTHLIFIQVLHELMWAIFEINASFVLK